MEVAVKPDEAMLKKGKEGAPANDAAEKLHHDAQHQKPAAGPHAKPQLTDPEKTPGAGALPDPDKPQDPDATG